MNKKLKQELKEKLKQEKEKLEKMLGGFAKKDASSEGDWNTKFPSMGAGSEGVDLEKEADEVEQYSTLLSIEQSLEAKFKNINLALKKIEKRGYGLCEKCNKSINVERLKISPEARFCLSCKK